MTAVIEYGERRHIRLLIKSCKNEDFQLVNVRYELYENGRCNMEDFGPANVIGHIIDIVVEPKKHVDYALRVTYQIADEILVDTVQIKVI